MEATAAGTRLVQRDDPSANGRVRFAPQRPKITLSGFAAQIDALLEASSLRPFGPEVDDGFGPGKMRRLIDAALDFVVPSSAAATLLSERRKCPFDAQFPITPNRPNPVARLNTLDVHARPQTSFLCVLRSNVDFRRLLRFRRHVGVDRKRV